MSLLTCNIKNSVPKNIVEHQQATLVNTMYEDEPCTPSLPGRCVNKDIRKSERFHAETQGRQKSLSIKVCKYRRG